MLQFVHVFNKKDKEKSDLKNKAILLLAERMSLFQEYLNSAVGMEMRSAVCFDRHWQQQI